MITVSTSFVEGISAGSQNDTVRLGTGARIDGLVDCGNGNEDSLVFTMTVPQDQIASISSQIAAANPAGGSITINGLFYEWEDCEELVNELNSGVPGRIRPYPDTFRVGPHSHGGSARFSSLTRYQKKID